MSSKIRYISELDQIANNMWDIMASVYTIEGFRKRNEWNKVICNGRIRNRRYCNWC